ncbi:Serine/threonine-protein kinase receptor [Aphelenchoides fujianensis]|nr:Serine/threonine-protein kinase receptor [Aphelenchoides fujianensis]
MLIRHRPSMTLLVVVLSLAISTALPANSSASNEDLQLPTADEAAAKGYKLLLGTNQTSVPNMPHFVKSHGKLGTNFNLDHGQPFIWCEQQNSTCVGTAAECASKMKCFPDRRSHRLGCMAVLVYNIRDADAQNQSIPDNTLMLKGCWSQYESELSECPERVRFCCCRTHNCNQKVILASRETEAKYDRELEKPTPQLEFIEEIQLVPNFFMNSTVYAIIAGFFFVFCLAVAICFTICECHALLGENALNLKNAKLCEVLSSGHFSELYRAEVEDVSVVIRTYHSSDSDGWINEQSLRTHENVVDFLCAVQQGQQYWSICRYYYNGSIYDHLEILSSMLTGLAFLHEECYIDGELKPTVVHRDFKSKNVLLKADLTACISDFSYAVKCENGRMANEENQAQVGTRRYMSPEVLEGATEFSGFAFQQVDVYAASLVMWEVLSRTRVPECPLEIVPEYMLPYARELGKQPTLGHLREMVVLRKFRPLARESLFSNAVLSKIVKTMRDMWDPEPDGRITSSCARDRVGHYFKSLVDSTDFHDGPPPPFFPDAGSITSSGNSYKTESAISSFDCPSATGTTIPCEAAKSASQNLTSSSEAN